MRRKRWMQEEVFGIAEILIIVLFKYYVLVSDKETEVDGSMLGNQRINHVPLGKEQLVRSTRTLIN